MPSEVAVPTSEDLDLLFEASRLMKLHGVSMETAMETAAVGELEPERTTRLLKTWRIVALGLGCPTDAIHHLLKVDPKTFETRLQGALDTPAPKVKLESFDQSVLDELARLTIEGKDASPQRIAAELAGTDNALKLCPDVLASLERLGSLGLVTLPKRRPEPPTTPKWRSSSRKRKRSS